MTNKRRWSNSKRLKIMMIVECPKMPSAIGNQNIGACKECKYVNEVAVELGYVFCDFTEEKFINNQNK